MATKKKTACKIPTYTHLDAAERKKLERLAQQNGRTVSSQLAQIVREYGKA